MCILCAKKIFFSAGVKKQQEKLKLLEKQVLLKEQSLNIHQLQGCCLLRKLVTQNAKNF
jgi:hypothetical protein